MSVYTVRKVVEAKDFPALTVEFEPTPYPKVQRHDQRRVSAGLEAYRRALKARGVRDFSTFDKAANADWHEEATEAQAQAVAEEEVTFLASKLKSWDLGETDATPALAIDPSTVSLLPFALFRQVYAVVLGYAGARAADDKKKSASPPS